MTLVTGLDGVEAEGDGENQILEQEAPAMIPAQLINLGHGHFLKQVLDSFPVHVSKFWSKEEVDKI